MTSAKKPSIKLLKGVLFVGSYLPNLHNHTLPISNAKKQDLLPLCREGVTLQNITHITLTFHQMSILVGRLCIKICQNHANGDTSR